MENTQNWINLIISVISGIAVCIPLVYKLVDYVKKAISEKNWNELVKMTMTYMAEAEKKYKDGADKKIWVMSMIQTSAQTINYNLDDAALAKISDLIDGICDASKLINTKK